MAWQIRQDFHVDVGGSFGTVLIVSGDNSNLRHPAPDVVSGDKMPVRFYFWTRGEADVLSVADPGSGAALRFSGRPATVPPGTDLLFLADTFTEVSAGVWEGEVDLNTTELVAHLEATPVGAKTIVAEIEVSDDNGGRKSLQFPMVVRPEVYEGQDAPTQLENPETWLTAQLANRNVQPVRTAATHFFPDEVSITGTVFDDLGDPIVTENLIYTGTDSEGFPSYDVALAEGGTLVLDRDSGDWRLTYSGPSTGSDLVWKLTSAVAWPGGLELVPDQNGQETLTLNPDPALAAPKVGDLGYLTGDELFYIWSGMAWMLVDVSNFNGYLSYKNPQTLTPTQKDQLAENWPEAVAHPKYDVIVVDGDSRSTGSGVGTWPTLLGSIKPFDLATVTSVAVSGAKSGDRVSDFSVDVNPLAPGSDERGLYMCLVGVNDVFQISGSVESPREIYENLVTLWTSAKALGFEVVAFTLPQHSFAAAGITEAEQRQEELNRLILADTENYDFLVPLHKLMPEETTYGIVGDNYIHFDSAGNQFIADQVAKILGNKDRSRSVDPGGQARSVMEFQAVPALVQTSRKLFPPFELSAAQKTEVSSGTVENWFGYQRLTAAAVADSQAAIRLLWPVLSTTNSINWATEKYRGILVDFDNTAFTEDHIFRVSVGTSGTDFDDAAFGFEFRRVGSSYELRVVAIDATGTQATGDWTTINTAPNIKILIFAKGDLCSLFYTQHNSGATGYAVWQQIDLVGAPEGSSGGTSNGTVCASITAANPAPASAAVLDVRSIQCFETETLPFARNEF
jgi:lysophospholipase L1-like esterase